MISVLVVAMNVNQAQNVVVALANKHFKMETARKFAKKELTITVEFVNHALVVVFHAQAFHNVQHVQTDSSSTQEFANQDVSMENS